MENTAAGQAGLDIAPRVRFCEPMLLDSHYLNRNFQVPEITHRYGERVHLLNDPFLFSTLSRFCDPHTIQPEVNHLLQTLYQQLVKTVINCEFPQKRTAVQSRMAADHPEGQFEADIIDDQTKVVAVNLARAGTLPSQICFDTFNHILDPTGVRQDHISINRQTDSSEKVIGTQVGGVKIGGSIEKAVLVFPDPMGATGSTIHSAMKIYKEEVEGEAAKYIAIHLIVTPEYLASTIPNHPDLIVYALRLDRGLSSKNVLQSIPGTHWKEEKGLNEKQYIVPGAGGVGEILNNSYV